MWCTLGAKHVQEPGFQAAFWLVTAKELQGQLRYAKCALLLSMRRRTQNQQVQFEQIRRLIRRETSAALWYYPPLERDFKTLKGQLHKLLHIKACSQVEK